MSHAIPATTVVPEKSKNGLRLPEVNMVMISGNLTADPTQKKFEQGGSVVHFRIASNRRFKTKAGEYEDDTTYVAINVFGEQADRCASTLKKGFPVVVEGRLISRDFEHDGQKRSVVEVDARRVQFVRFVSPTDKAANQEGPDKSDEVPF